MDGICDFRFSIFDSGFSHGILIFAAISYILLYLGMPQNLWTHAEREGRRGEGGEEGGEREGRVKMFEGATPLPYAWFLCEDGQQNAMQMPCAAPPSAVSALPTLLGSAGTRRSVRAGERRLCGVAAPAARAAQAHGGDSLFELSAVGLSLRGALDR